MTAAQVLEFTTKSEWDTYVTQLPFRIVSDQNYTNYKTYVCRDHKPEGLPRGHRYQPLCGMCGDVCWV